MFTIKSNILSKSGLTADDINKLVAGTGLAGLGTDFVNCESNYGINAYFVMAHAIIESNWGNSWFAVHRNNLFGLDAYDSDPMKASSYASKAACIDYYGHFLRNYYLTPGAVYFAGDTPHGVFVHYSSSHDAEAKSVVSVMNNLAAKDSKVVQPVTRASAPAPAIGTVNSRTYTVQPGDNMSAIAAKYGLHLQRLEQLNPRAGHPAENFDNIWPGDVLKVSAANPPAVPVHEPIYIVVPRGYDGYESVIAAKYHTTVQQLLDWNKPVHPTMTADYLQAGWRIRVR